MPFSELLSPAASLEQLSVHLIDEALTGLALSGVAMVAAGLGWLAPVQGAVLQELIDVAVTANALRALRA